MKTIEFVARVWPGCCAAAALVGLGIWLWKRSRTSALLAAYAFFIFCLAVLARSSQPEAQVMLRPFWSYAEWSKEGVQILANIAAFVPLGYLLGRLYGWKGVWAGVGFSILIELLQLISHRGMCEFDDVFHNTLGTVLGVALEVLLRRRREKKHRSGED